MTVVSSAFSAAVAQGQAGPRARYFCSHPPIAAGPARGRCCRRGQRFALADRLRSSEGAPLGELFAFVSGLYFRGKLTYARRFAVPPDPASAISGSVHIITPNAGLRSPDTLVTARRHARVRRHRRPSRQRRVPPAARAKRPRARRRDRPRLRRRPARKHRLAEVCRRPADHIRRPAPVSRSSSSGAAT